ncbi:MAG: tetratricopeptide repeat protein, partial [Coleofasciculaceae cyanobacterium]
MNEGEIFPSYKALGERQVERLSLSDAYSEEAVALYEQGNEQLDAKDFSGAVASYDRALEIQSDYHQAWHNRGVALGNLGQYEQAIASFDKALEIQHECPYAWLNRSVALENLGRHEEAIASLDKALDIKSDDHYAWFIRGVALDHLGQY